MMDLEIAKANLQEAQQFLLPRNEPLYRAKSRPARSHRGAFTYFPYDIHQQSVLIESCCLHYLVFQQSMLTVGG